MPLRHFHFLIPQCLIADHQVIGHSFDKALWRLRCIDLNLLNNQMPIAFVQLAHQIHVKTMVDFLIFNRKGQGYHDIRQVMNQRQKRCLFCNFVGPVV